MTATFELLRFEATPLTAAVAVVELEGTFAGLSPARPRLLVESGGESREMPALEAGGSPWSAAFAIPLTVLAETGASFALVPGRGPLIELPPPTRGGDPDEDRFVKLARTTNDLRHRLSVALDRAEDRDHLARELAEMRDRVAAGEERVAEAHESAMAAREEQARAEGEADAAREALARTREEARAEVREEIEATQGEAEAARAQAREDVEAAHRDAEAARAQLAEAEQRALAAEDEARAARLELRDARARIEALVRESRTIRTAAARERVATPHIGGGEEEFRAARLGPDWTEGDEHAPTEPVDEEDAVAEPEPPGEDETAPLPASSPSVGDPTTTAELSPVEPASGDEGDGSGPELWRDDSESVRVLRPRTRAGRRRPAAVPDVETDELEEHALQPAAVGARAIRPAETHRHPALEALSNPRVIVGGIFLLLLVALVLIFSGAGPV